MKSSWSGASGGSTTWASCAMRPCARASTAARSSSARSATAAAPTSPRSTHPHLTTSASTWRRSRSEGATPLSRNPAGREASLELGESLADVGERLPRGDLSVDDLGYAEDAPVHDAAALTDAV